MIESLQLEPGQHGMLVSRCGRYSVLVRQGRLADEWMSYGYWYGYLVHRHRDVTSAITLSAMQTWLAAHRSRYLPKVAEFEGWAAQHYQINLGDIPGALARRDRLKRLIFGTDPNLAFNFDGQPLTLAQMYRKVYENIEPEGA